MYESFFPHAKSKFDFSIALKNIGFRSVVEEVSALDATHLFETHATTPLWLVYY